MSPHPCVEASTPGPLSAATRVRSLQRVSERGPGPVQLRGLVGEGPAGTPTAEVRLVRPREGAASHTRGSPRTPPATPRPWPSGPQKHEKMKLSFKDSVGGTVLAARTDGQAPWTSVAGTSPLCVPRTCPPLGLPLFHPLLPAVAYPPTEPPGLAQLARGPGAGSSSFVSINEAQWSPGRARCRGHFLPTDMPAPHLPPPPARDRQLTERRSLSHAGPGPRFWNQLPGCRAVGSAQSDDPSFPN